eukprot:Gb_36100 [translate_table: standard]
MTTQRYAYRLTAVAIAVVLTTAAVRPTYAQVTCPTVTSALTPCLSFLLTGGQVPDICCDGVRRLTGMARTTLDRQAACKCLKTAAGSINPLPSSLTNLPGACGVNIGIPISTDIDCSQVH